LYVFGFALTARPLVRAGWATDTVISIALAADAFSITIMKVIEKVVAVPIPARWWRGSVTLSAYASIAAGFAIAHPSPSSRTAT
jgi:hypothetical protein